MELTTNDLQQLLDKRNGGLPYDIFRKKVYRWAPGNSKYDLYYLRGRCCEWPGCTETEYKKLTVDHVVPVSVAYRLGWSVRRCRSYGNLQILCHKHHRYKDRNVHELIYAVIKILGLPLGRYSHAKYAN